MSDMPVRNITEPHVALALVLDVSASMGESTDGIPAIDLLNNSVNSMVRGLKENNRLRSIVDLSIFIFGETTKQNPYISFRAIEDFEDIHLEANDKGTFIVNVLEEAVEATKQRCRKYLEYGTPCYKPWVVVITDGNFLDSEADLERICQLMRSIQRDGKQHFFGFGVGNYDRQQLEKFCDPELVQNRVFDISVGFFPELLTWIGKSQNYEARIEPGDPLLDKVAQLKQLIAEYS